MDSNPLFPFLNKNESNPSLDLFESIMIQELNTKDIELYSKINDSTIKISSYFNGAIQKFPSLFENNLETFIDCLDYLEKISVPNKCICAGIIDIIPGWECVDCSKNSNGIYCNDCYLNSKDWHKDHKVIYSPDAEGMCDCGDPDALCKHCREHSGPFTEKKQIEDYIQKNFGKKVEENLRKFFDEFFIEFSKYLILTSKCDLFFEDIFFEKFEKEINDDLDKEREDVIFLKNNFCIVFQNLIYFLRLITKKNVGMLHLISDYLLKNNLSSMELEEEFMVDHQCIEISQDDIKIYYNNDKKEKHFCKCPFLRLFLENYRDDINLNSEENEEKEFIFSFVHNLPLRFTYGILNYFLYNQILYNSNKNVIDCRTQFYLEDALELIGKKTTLIENSADSLYKYLSNLLNNNNNNLETIINKGLMNKILMFLSHFGEDSSCYSKPKIRVLMAEKTSYYKRFINLACLFHNCYEYTSSVPHPPFNYKTINNQLLNNDTMLVRILVCFMCLIDYKNIDKLKDIYKYIINKILNQKNEGIKQLEENQFSFFLSLYRIFGKFINFFCFNYSFLNKCSILESINYFEKNFFESQEQVDNLVDIVLKDYYKFFGFLSGTKNNFFNYYDKANIYPLIYTSFDFYKNDFTLLKYMIILSKKEIDLNHYYKVSNIENVYSKFNDIFNLGKIKENKEPESPNSDGIDNIIFPLPEIKDISQEEFNIIMQWETLLEFLICLLKDDSSNYLSIIEDHEKIYSSKTKMDLLNILKSNELVKDDLKNILKEQLILNIISQGNLIDKKNLEKNIDNYLLSILNENNEYEQILEELTYNKKDGDTIIFYLKDEYLKYLDCNYFINFQDKSKAQKYILNFKKDIVKTYNYYYYNNSELTFDFFKTVYEKVFLSKNNLDLIIRVVEKLINNDEIMNSLDKQSIRNSLLPKILNYILMFSVLNTKSFIEFKIENKKEINNLYNLLFNYVKNVETNNQIDKDLVTFIKDVLNKMNQYQLIYDTYKGDLSKLNLYDYNTDFLEQIKKKPNLDLNIKQIISEDLTIVDEKKQKSKKAKENLKLLLKKKANGFMEKIEANEEMKKAIDENINDIENMKNKEDEIMCFYCRNSIKLNSFEEPYGKLGLIINDLFYTNSIKATLREEFEKIKLKDKNDLYDKIININNPEKFDRIIFSCGHFFHNKCFIDGLKKKNFNHFACPVCLKRQNVLIPPLTLFHDKFPFLISGKLNEFLEEEKNKEEKKESNNEINLFYTTVITFLTSVNIFKDEINNYSQFLDDIFPKYQAHLNFVENIFYNEGTTFHKLQQIDNIKNLILSLRLIFYNSQDSNKKDIIEFIKETLIKLANGPEEKVFCYNYHDSYMHYYYLFEKIILSMEILFDYEEIKKTFKYILYIFLPYFCFGLYYKKLIIDKENNILNKEQIKQKLNLDEFYKYLKDDNKQIMKLFTEFLRKFCFIKMISDYQNKNENIFNSINSLSFDNILTLIDMEDLIKILPKNDIYIDDIINLLPKTFDSNNIIYKIFPNKLNFDKVLNSIFENVNKYNNEEYELNKELIIQFIPIKFNFIHLEKNIFDFLEKYVTKKCSLCDNLTSNSYICLICGEKVCNPKKNDDIIIHIDKCTDNFCIYIDTTDMKVYHVDRKGYLNDLFPIYINKSGTGPKRNEITNEFYLSEEKLKTIIKNYVSRDFNLKNN